MASDGFVVWFTGLSGSGKSTLAARLAAELRGRGESVELLDGDEVRTHLSRGLGFSRADRDTNVLRIGFVARLLARHGACAITAAISPYRAARDECRAGTDRFLEVWCRAPVEALAARDPKGLYQKALRGEITGFTGVDDPYEEPLAAEVVCDTAAEDVEASLARVLGALGERGWLGGGVAPPLRRTREGADLDAAPHGGALDERTPTAATREQLVAEARALVTLPVGAAVEDLLDAFGTGLLSPLRGFTTEREDHAILHGRRLERGVPWPTRVLLSAPEEHPAAGAPAGTSIALSGREGGARAIVDVAETFRLSPRTVEIAGDVTVLRTRDGLASASETRARLAAGGFRRVIGHMVRDRIEAPLVRAALLLGDALLLACPGELPDLGALDLRPAEVPRILLVRVARLPARVPADAVLEAIALKNLGASMAVLDPVPFAASAGDAELSLRAHLAGWPRSSLGIDVVVLSSLEQDARRAIEAAMPAPLPAGMLDDVVAAHRVGRRAYHDLAHVAAVARAVDEAGQRAGEPTSLETFLAVLFHDAVYDPSRRDNEARSAELANALAGRWLRDCTLDCARVEHLILLTARHGRIASAEVDAAAARFLDADMAILGAPPEVFDCYDEAVAWEYAAAVPETAWQEGRRRFLQGLLDQPRIFLTDEAHARLDAAARENVRRALARVEGTGPDLDEPTFVG